MAEVAKVLTWCSGGPVWLLRMLADFAVDVICAFLFLSPESQSNWQLLAADSRPRQIVGDAKHHYCLAYRVDHLA